MVQPQTYPYQVQKSKRRRAKEDDPSEWTDTSRSVIQVMQKQDGPIGWTEETSSKPLSLRTTVMLERAFPVQTHKPFICCIVDILCLWYSAIDLVCRRFTESSEKHTVSSPVHLPDSSSAKASAQSHIPKHCLHSCPSRTALASTRMQRSFKNVKERNKGPYPPPHSLSLKRLACSHSLHTNAAKLSRSVHRLSLRCPRWYLRRRSLPSLT